MISADCCKQKNYEVTGIFMLEVEAYDVRDAKEKAGRILSADGIGHSVVDVREMG